MASDAPSRVHIRRACNVRDEAGNAYGILDVHPGPDDPAILLGILLAATGERVGLTLRPGDTVVQPGLRMAVEQLSTDAPASLTLVASPSESGAPAS